ncbi:hypothetical protein L249_8081 [Ophiocordyceps polyrhachis-furcata BCC 54312]|uniref:Uncharacterized protein n=1 Tax=Ophiocordyceps polyrhachis-furcata BCC 54312 TaxID=1330021 RepID=A0A367LH55_9HYPO|nr:hypothetical protein L249_8081 [Ophiocordyceps polyrhachis-furcata BCC 54312]
MRRMDGCSGGQCDDGLWMDGGPVDEVQMGGATVYEYELRNRGLGLSPLATAHSRSLCPLSPLTRTPKWPNQTVRRGR